MTLNPRRPGVLLLSLIVLSATTGDTRVSGQTEPARGYAAVIPMPSLTLNPMVADLNNDGRMDLVAGRRLASVNNELSGGELVAVLGNGDGTFGAEVPMPTATPMAAPLTLGDFNGDGNIDVVAMELRQPEPEAAPRQVWILPGRGDGTFDAGILIASHGGVRDIASAPNTGMVADFDGDSNLDFAIALEPNILHVYPGNGDLTFDPAATFTTSARPYGATAVDLNGDGAPDMAIATRDGQAVDVFLNQGGFDFGVMSTGVGRAAQDVTATDLNGDGRVDLVVAAATEDFDQPGTFHDGRVIVMLGNGDGTFQPASGYPTPRGTLAVVTGDFTRDGVMDVAAANFTGTDVEECGPLFGSVSILAGNGAGALGSAASYQLTYDPLGEYLNRIQTLYVALLDGDGYPDLATAGGILLSRPASPNRAPTADAGPDKSHDDPDQTPTLEGSASDPDNDFLSYEWRDETGRVVERCLHPTLYFPPGPGSHSYTLTVRDDRGGSASDSVILTNTTTNNSPALQIHRPDFGNRVPAYDPYLIQWSVTDPDGGTITDIDISVDRNGQTNFTPIAACTNLSGSASECVWSDPGPPSNDAALLFRITDSQGDVISTVARFQIVPAPAGALPSGWSSADVGAVDVAGASGHDGRVFTVRGSGADIWNTADEFHWAFTTVAGDFEITARVGLVQNVNPWTKAGLMIRETQAAGSRHASIFATPGTTKPVSFQRRPMTDGVSVHTAGPIDAPPVWLMLRRTGDVIAAFYRPEATGDWVPLGTQELPGLATTVQVGLPVSSHVAGTTASAAFDNVSVSIAGAPDLEVLRPAAGEEVQINAYYTVRWMPAGDGSGIARYDILFAGSSSGPWTAIADCANIPGDARSCVWERPSPLGQGFIKVVATSTTGAQGEAQSGPFEIRNIVTGTGGTPPGWTCGDVGDVAAPGSCSYEVEDELYPDFVVSGSGSDIWGTADEFSFARYAAYGDFSLTTQVHFVENINRWTKAGIMIRDWNGQSPAPAGARHASFFVTPSTEKGTAFQRRPTNGGISVHTPGPVTTVPVWLKLIRTGDTIRAYYRKAPADPWTLIGQEVFEGLPYELSAMLVVSSHVDGTLATARFDSVVIDEPQPMASADIGGSAAGTTSSDGPEITVEGNGADIWGGADAFRFHYTTIRGNASILVRVRSLEAVHAWSKAGVMFRESLDPGSKHVMAIVSPSRGLAMQSRAETGGLSASTGPLPGTAPVWLYLRRYGDEFTASWSSDGEQWHGLGQTTLLMNNEILVGLPVTSHTAGTLASALFDDLVIER